MILKPIHLYFDKFVDGNPQGNGLMPEYENIKELSTYTTDPNMHPSPVILETLNDTSVDYKVSPVEDIYKHNDDCHNVFVLEPLNSDLFGKENIFEHISDIAKEHIRNKKLHLLVYHPLEPFIFELLYSVNDSAKLEDFPVDNISLICGDLSITENYAKLPVTKPIEFNRIFPSPFWELSQRKCEMNTTEEPIPAERSVSMKNRSSRFLCFNGAARRHRLIVVSEMIRRNIINQGLVSMVGRYDFVPTIHQQRRWPYEYFDKDNPIELEMASHLSVYLKNWKPRYLDINIDELNADDRQVDKNLYLDTYFSVVTETEMADGVLFLTEKTFKPIMNLHPFIMIGSCGTLAYLRSIGYETFPEIFNESYDDEPDEKKRLLMVLDEVEKIAQCQPRILRKLYYRAWPKLIHNRNLFLTRDHKQEHETVFDNIFKGIENV